MQKLEHAISVIELLRELPIGSVVQAFYGGRVRATYKRVTAYTWSWWAVRSWPPYTPYSTGTRIITEDVGLDQEDCLYLLDPLEVLALSFDLPADEQETTP